MFVNTNNPHTLADAQDINSGNIFNILGQMTSGDPNDLIAVAQGVLTKKHPNYDNLSKGARGDQVFTLQQLLCNAGYPTDNDGIFGEKTYQTLLQYQRDNQLQQTGSSNNETWSKLIPQNPNWEKIKSSCSSTSTDVTGSGTATTTTTNEVQTQTQTNVPADTSNNTMWIVIMVIMGLLIFGTLIFFILK